MKTCTICKKDSPKESFYKTSSCCKPCKSQYNKDYEKKRKKKSKYTYKW